MEHPPIAVLIPTYNRAATVAAAVKGFRTHAATHYPGKVTFYVGCDGDDETPSVFTGVDDVVVFDNGTPLGLGANLNMLISSTTEPVLFQMDDDHILKQEIDLTSHVHALYDNEKIGWIRLYGVGFHKYVAHLDGHYWIVRWDSPELYINSMRPHIKLRAWHAKYGMYPEGVRLGQTEEQFCHQCKNIGVKDVANWSSSMHVAIPLIGDTENSWDHVGSSWQAKGK